MKYLETEPQFYRDTLRIALPITLQSVITIGVSMLDTIMLGSLGENALSASSLGNQFIGFFQICCMGIGMGASVLTSRFYGRGDSLSLHKAVCIALRFTLLFSALFTAVNACAPQAILRLYTGEAALIAEGAVYLRWSTATFLLTGLSMVCTNILRSVNITRVSLLASIGAFFINVGANYVFIFGKLGAPRMGTAGAALGTVLARLFEAAVICGYFFCADTRIRFRVRRLLLPCADLTHEYLRVSIPVLVSDGLLGLGSNVLGMIMGHIGAAFVSANAITMVTQQISTVFIQGLSFAGSIVTGQTLGQGRAQAARRQGYTFFWLGLAIGTAAGLVIYLIRTPVINAYNITPATRDITEQLMDAISVIVVFQAANSILTKGVLRGGGDTRFLMVADILFLWVVSIPLGMLAAFVWRLPAFWIYLCLKIDQFIKAVWCVFRLHSGKWIKTIHGAPDPALTHQPIEEELP